MPFGIAYPSKHPQNHVRISIWKTSKRSNTRREFPLPRPHRGPKPVTYVWCTPRGHFHLTIVTVRYDLFTGRAQYRSVFRHRHVQPTWSAPTSNLRWTDRRRVSSEAEAETTWIRAPGDGLILSGDVL